MIALSRVYGLRIDFDDTDQYFVLEPAEGF